MNSALCYSAIPAGLVSWLEKSPFQAEHVEATGHGECAEQRVRSVRADDTKCTLSLRN